jgi:uncharacterized protein (TIGR00251 family)
VTYGPVFTVAGSTITVRVFAQPRSSRPGIAGRHGDALKVRVAAPPEDGRANDEVCRLLARALGVPRRSVRVTSGRTSRTKTVEVECHGTPTVAGTAAGLRRLVG